MNLAPTRLVRPVSSLDSKPRLKRKSTKELECVATYGEIVRTPCADSTLADDIEAAPPDGGIQVESGKPTVDAVLIYTAPTGLAHMASETT